MNNLARGLAKPLLSSSFSTSILDPGFYVSFRLADPSFLKEPFFINIPMPSLQKLLFRPLRSVIQ